MRRISLLIIVCWLLATQLPAKPGPITFISAGTEATIEDDFINLKFALDNPSGQQIHGKLKINLLAPDDTIKSTKILDADLPRGTATLSTDLPFKFTTLSLTESKNVYWFRVKAYLTDENGKPLATKTWSLSEIAPELFSMRVAAEGNASIAQAYTVRVTTQHFLKESQVAGVNVTASLMSDKTVIAIKDGATNGNGWLTLSFDSIPVTECEGLTLKVVASKHGIKDEYTKPVKLAQDLKVFITNDKPIYQPGQTIHTRLLVFTQPIRRAAPLEKGELEISNFDGETLYHTEFTTNDYGVASTDWTMPEEMGLGDYIVRVSLDEGGSEDASFKVSRYELPTFEVKTESDRKFYLPGQNAKITVDGIYLFGKPVSRGRVRIVRESERRWDYKAQKWDIKEEAVYEGVANDQGRFVTSVKLDNAFGESDDRKKDPWDRTYPDYRDVNFAAYVTDTSTGRTEQHRFDVRVSREPIHIYINDGVQAKGLPLDLFITTNTADGQAVSAMVSMIDKTGKISAVVQTNSAGQGRYTATKALTDNENLKIRFLAKDKNGRTGASVQNIYVQDSMAIRMKSDRILYTSGDPIHISLQSSAATANLMVDVVAEHHIQRGLTVGVKNHKAEFTIPYDTSFQGEVTIAAFSPEIEYSNGLTTRRVLYPQDKELSLKVNLTKSEYRPGETVTGAIAAVDSKGNSLVSALGVNVIDRALEVRADTDNDFGSSYRTPYFAETFTPEDRDQTDLAKLFKYDPKKPLPAEIALAVEAYLARYYYYYTPSFDRGSRADIGFNRRFEPLFEPHLDRDRAMLAPVFDAYLKEHKRYPANPVEIQEAFQRSGMDPNSILDPWGNPYRQWSGVQGPIEGSQLFSNGPDQIPNTQDDILLMANMTPYFAGTSEFVRKAMDEYHFRTDKFVQDQKTLTEVLQRAHFDFSQLRDKWGAPYRITFINQNRYQIINISSNGPDRKPRTKDDFQVSTIKQDYMAEVESTITSAVYDHFVRTKHFPENREEFLRAEREAGVDFPALKDVLGGTFYAEFSKIDHFDDSVAITSNSEQNQQVKVEPVKRKYQVITIRCTGPDHKEGTNDDFTLVRIDQLIAEQGLFDVKPHIVQDDLNQSGPINGKAGMVRGPVFDPIKAVIANSEVEVVNLQSGEVRKTQTGSDGLFMVFGLIPGNYKIRVTAIGFKSAIITAVYVRGGGATTIDVTLSVGSATETITVSGTGREVLNTQTSDVVNNGKAVSIHVVPNMATPRVRQYFPENLLWQPMLITDEKGEAHLEFKLGDTITTWKMGVVGSTKDGRIATAQAEIKAFQPFFIEPDPPKVLTEGDEISLPVVVRNYTNQKQDVKLSMTPAAWFTLQDNSEKNVSTPSGESVTEHFRLTAVASGEQKQTITGIGSNDSDAVEKTIAIHPDGEEISQTIGDLVAQDAKFEVNVPDYALASGRQLKLKLYPNLFSQALEGIEGVLQRPGGCAEQTISSTYPNLLVLQYLKQTGKSLPKVQATAQKNLQLGYDRLTNFVTADGGVGYFIGYKSEFALTAYALRFLADASEFISIDDDMQKKLQDWLLKQQDAEGRWISDSSRFRRIYEDGAPRETAYVCSILARSLKNNNPQLKKCLDYSEKASTTFPDPYVTALYTLAQLDAGNKEKAITAAKQLEQTALTEGPVKYWSLEVNTPFYGWGSAGRVETTALALEAIARTHRLPEWKQSSTAGVINQATLFLIKQKDRYGVWYTSQATVRALHSLIALSDEQIATPSTELAITINNGHRKQVALPPGNELSNFITVDLSEGIRSGNNVIELRRTSNGQSIAVQLVEAHYIPWSKSQNIGRSKDLRMSVNIDRQEANAGETINYNVEVERIAFRGYGMMLAEVGIPPGCDVDRASIERAVTNSNWDLWRYDVLPDRVVFYVWPRATATRIHFSVKPRFSIRAKQAASVLYDYYNPEARVTVEPRILTVR